MKIRHGLNQQNIATRLGELRDLGIAKECRKRACSVTGLTVIEWDVTADLPVKRPKPTEHKCPFCKGSGKLFQERLL
jgi:hypothetical protein